VSAALSRRIEQPVLAVLSAGRCDGAKFFLPERQLDRKLYESTNKVLDALGGKWNRSAKAHVFPEACADLIDSAIETGSYTRPADMGWFPTPPELADQIAAMADIHPGMFVLEPSAGEGALARAAYALSDFVRCIEVDQKRAEKLAYWFDPTLVTRVDFLEVTPHPAYDRVVMNPPFAKRADIHHVMHARNFLKPGGKLVSIMSGGILFREDALTTQFRALCSTIEALPEGSFTASGTDVRTCVITMDMPQ
jgi:phospholipid N-methyltransferase